MTKKEKNKLALLANKIIENTEILHLPAMELLVDRLEKAFDDEVLDILIKHVDYIRIYEIYNRFDREACSQDIGKLFTIIDNITATGD